MNNTFIKAGILVFYITILSKIMNFKLLLIINIPYFIMVLSGALLLTLISFQKGGGKYNFILKLKTMVIVSGFLTSFLANIAFLSKEITDINGIYKNIVLNFLPMFYAFLIYFVIDLLRVKVSESDLIIDSYKEEPDIEKLEDYDLTKRELAVCKEIQMNLSNSEIADKLFISENTVKKHINHIFQKVGVRNRTEFINKFQKLK